MASNPKHYPTLDDLVKDAKAEPKKRGRNWRAARVWAIDAFWQAIDNPSTLPALVTEVMITGRHPHDILADLIEEADIGHLKRGNPKSWLRGMVRPTERLGWLDDGLPDQSVRFVS